MADRVQWNDEGARRAEVAAGKGMDLIIQRPGHRRELKNFRRRVEQTTSMVEEDVVVLETTG